jgi:hypothetical protein
MTSPLSETAKELVRARAYQIYESNGRQDLHAEQDWLQAEQEVIVR